MTQGRLILELEAVGPGGGAAARAAPTPPWITLAPAGRQKPVAEGEIRLVVWPTGFQVLDRGGRNGSSDADGAASSGLGVTPFGQWHLLPAWRVRVKRTAAGRDDASVVDVANWAAPELKVSVGDAEGGAGEWKRYPLPTEPGAEFLVGRSLKRAHVHVDDDRVSGVHLRFRCAGDGGYTVADEQTLNGSTLNGSPLAGPPVVLAHGDRLKIGTVVIEYANVTELLKGMQAAATPPAAEGVLAEGVASVAGMDLAAAAVAAPAVTEADAVAPAAPSVDGSSSDARDEGRRRAVWLWVGGALGVAVALGLLLYIGWLTWRSLGTPDAGGAGGGTTRQAAGK